MGMMTHEAGGPLKELHNGRETVTPQKNRTPYRSPQCPPQAEDGLLEAPRRRGSTLGRRRRRRTSHGSTSHVTIIMIQVVVDKRSIRRPLALSNNSVHRVVTEKGQGGRHGPPIMAPRGLAWISLIDDTTKQPGNVESREGSQRHRPDEETRRCTTRSSPHILPEGTHRAKRVMCTGDHPSS